MILTIINVVYVLVAVAMIALILFQRGSGAAAGSGFGGGASATVFGARGASNFLSKSTAILAILFFVISLAMAVSASRMGATTAAPEEDLGVMGQLEQPAPAGDAAVPTFTPQAGEDVPSLPSAPAPDAAQPQGAPADAAPAEAAPTGDGGSGDGESGDKG